MLKVNKEIQSLILSYYFTYKNLNIQILIYKWYYELQINYSQYYIICCTMCVLWFVKLIYNNII